MPLSDQTATDSADKSTKTDTDGTDKSTKIDTDGTDKGTIGNTKKKAAKKYYRCHAHSNAFKDNLEGTPHSPSTVEWKSHFKNGKEPKFLDLGCGYGRFLLKVGEMEPEKNILGIELREKVAEYVRIRTGPKDNVSVVNTNALFYLPNFIAPGTVEAIFVLFPDPHFKKRKQKGRLVCREMMAVFEYLLVPNGLFYVSSDVDSLFSDMCLVIEGSGLFERSSERETGAVFEGCFRDTDEAHRAGVKTGHTMGRVYQKIN